MIIVTDTSAFVRDTHALVAIPWKADLEPNYWPKYTAAFTDTLTPWL